MQAEVHGRHAEVAALRVHDAVVVRERERAGPAEGVARQQRDGREGEVEQRREQGEEAGGVGVWVCGGLGEVEALFVRLVRLRGEGRRGEG